MTAGWEALQRLGRASGTRVVGVPYVLGRRIPGSGPAALGFGNDVIARRAAIDLTAAHGGLDPDTVSALLDRCALDTAALITDDLERGRLGSAVATAGEVMRLTLSDAARAVVTDALARSLT